MICLRRGLPVALSLSLWFGASELKAQQAPAKPAEPAASSAQTVVPFQRAFPQTFAKLQAKQPVRVLAIGDSSLGYFGYGTDAGNVLKAAPALFLQKLADRYRLDGGVRWTNPKKRYSDKLVQVHGPELLYECHAFQGKGMESAADILATYGPLAANDLVVVSFGVNNAIAGTSLERFRASLVNLLAKAKSLNVELLLLTPHVLITDPAEVGMGLTRPYADVMLELAAKEGVTCIDMGDLRWLTQLDLDRDPQLVPVVPSAEVLQNPSPIVSPFAEAQNPDPEMKAARLFEDVVRDYRKFFDHGNQVDWVHPGEHFQSVLGRRLFNELMGERQPSAWKVADASFSLLGDDQSTLSYTLVNTTDKPLQVTLLPMVVPAWSPKTAPSVVEIPAKGRTRVQASYGKTALNHLRTDSYLPAKDTVLRFPVMHVSGATVKIDDVRANLEPVNVLWQTDTQFNVDKQMVLQGELYNGSAKAVKGTWNAIWQGQNRRGEFSLEPNVRTPIQLAFDLPKDLAIRRLQGSLEFTVQVGDISYHLDRQVELVRNLGLGDRVPLMMSDIASQDTPPQEAAPKAKVWFEAKADAKALHLVWDIEGVELDENADEQLSLVAETSLDARSYGKRLLPGAVGIVRAGSKNVDGIGAVDELSPWAFGSAYAMEFDRKGVHTQLQTLKDGSRRFTLSLPRNYLYLHEWSLGNGNSQIGLNTTLQIWRSGLTSDRGAFVPFRLSPNPLSRHDAQSLVPLELTEQPTKRWTVRLY